MKSLTLTDASLLQEKKNRQLLQHAFRVTVAEFLCTSGVLTPCYIADFAHLVIIPKTSPESSVIYGPILNRRSNIVSTRPKLHREGNINGF